VPVVKLRSTVTAAIPFTDHPSEEEEEEEELSYITV